MGVKHILDLIKSAVWGTPTLALLIILGVYFTFKSKFYRRNAFLGALRLPFASLKRGKGGGVSSFAAAATALGGTVGVGSIVGVGYAIAVGGAGSIFWMWVCSFFGIGLKYAEVKIALDRREHIGGTSVGGAPYRLNGLGYRKTALAFCFLCIAASFGTGNITQIGAVSSFFCDIGVGKALTSVLCCAVVALAVFGGRRRIAGINSFAVPIASVIYLFVCLVILLVNIRGILPALLRILREAFGFSAVTGGFSGALLAQTLREGFARSMFSNEAGMGSSPLAHATAETDDVAEQARWGIFEVFFDTFVVSTLTALCLLSGGYSGASDMFTSFFGDIGLYLFGGLTAVFAFASVISWCYYAECCLSFVFKSKKAPFLIYRICFLLATLFGVYISSENAFAAADILNALMMFPNLFLLFICRNEIERME